MSMLHPDRLPARTDCDPENLGLGARLAALARERGI